MQASVTSEPQTQTTRWLPYPAYKDSGVEWLGEIPAHWDARRLGFVVKQKITDGPHVTPEFLSEGVPFLSVDGIQNGELVFEGCRYISETDHNEYKRKAFPQRGDILLGKAASTGKIAQVKVDFEFSIWSPLALIRPDSSVIDSTFLEYALKSPQVQSQIDVLCTSNTQKNISMDDIPLLMFPLPSFCEQAAIAAFLDRETARIDALIARKQRLIELLQEKRSALISRAVTQGLDPNVEMKDSDIPSIGLIPQHWAVERNRWIFREVNDRSTTGEEELLTVSHITGVTPRSEKQEVSMFLAESMEGYKRCQPNDLVINTMWAWMGALGISQHAGIVSPSYNVYRPTREYVPRYLDLLYRTPAYVCEITRYSQGVWTSRLRLYPQSFFEMHTLTPPVVEQQAIVDYIETEFGRNQTFMAKLNKSIEALTGYRTALISAAVAGKIDVRPSPLPSPSEGEGAGSSPLRGEVR